jgi:hypothetical protein
MHEGFLLLQCYHMLKLYSCKLNNYLNKLIVDLYYMVQNFTFAYQLSNFNVSVSDIKNRPVSE